MQNRRRRFCKRLIKLPTNALPVVWSLSGKPVLKDVEWRENMFNLTGFLVDTNNPPTFEEFFSPCAELPATNIFRLNAAGAWTHVTAPATTTMLSGEAFWIRSGAYTEYQGPVRAGTGLRSGLDYGLCLMEHELRICNESAGPQAVQIRSLPARAPPTGAEQPLRAGDVPLSWWNGASTNGPLGAWEAVSSLPLTNTVPAGEEWRVRLAVRRADMAAFTPPPGKYGDYQGLLDVTTSGGSRTIVPVHALGLVTTNDAGIRSMRHAGLWVGSAVIDKVNQPIQPEEATNNPAQPVSVGPGAAFHFRVILHVDTNGLPRLLQQVCLMWQDGTYTNAPADPGVNIVDQPGRYVLVTDDSLLSQFSSSTLRDGIPVGRRISSSGFSFDEPITAVAGADGSEFRFLVPLGYDQPENPFLHQYHPDHDNLDDEGADLQVYTNQHTFVATNLYGEACTNQWEDVYTREAYTVTRLIELRFTEEDPEGLALAGWGDDQLGGIWRETITGLRHQALHVEGRFRLHHTSRVGVLNDGLEVP